MRKGNDFDCLTRKAILILPLVLLFSCAPAKFVPEGSLLLDRVEIRTDAADINSSDLTDYLRQMPNSYILNLFRMQLGIYNLSGSDTTKSINRFIRSIGQEPVILDTMLTDITSRQLLSYHVNKGYYNATIDTDIVVRKPRRAKLIYNITAGEPYRIAQYKVDVPNEDLNSIASDSVRSLLQPGLPFDVYVLNNERDRVASKMRQQGFYNFTKDMMAFRADSSDMKVDVTLELRDFLMGRKDTLEQTVFRRFHIRNIHFNLIASTSSENSTIDTLQNGFFSVSGPETKFLTLNALRAATFIKPETLFSDNDVERTYASLNSLPPVKYTHISFLPVAGDSLDCHITVAETKSLSLSSKAEVTFTEGYWGGALNLGLVNRNLFRGAESLSFNGRMALERQEDVIAQEWGGQAGIKVPRILIPEFRNLSHSNFYGNTEFRSSFNYQYRPGEFSATNVGGGVKYTWRGTSQTHNFDLLDLSYVYFPWISQQFRDSFLVTGKYNRYNYEDYLIMRINYSSSFSSYNANRPMRNYFTYRYGFETAGNVLYGINKLFNSSTDIGGSYRVFNIRYSQYVRGEFYTSYHQIIDKNNKFVYHAGMGLGIPYGNAEIIPFERRFYGGGASSVRGWSESTLGPGSYERFALRRRDYNQVGDIKLDLNFEYRSKLIWFFEGAFFFDAGNIWTIRDYESQTNGVFRFDQFSKQIALAYGVGLRMNFDFFLLRVDLGFKLFDPAGSGKWNYLPSSKNSAVHLAIGYPF